MSVAQQKKVEVSETPAPTSLTDGACWSCHGPVAADALFCATCNAVQPPGTRDHFARFGFAPTFDIDAATLEKRYFDLQRKLHPDRFATKTPRERAISQQQATSLNDAYETLADPLRRAAYIAHLHGIDILNEGCNQIADPVVLMEAMELREAVADANSVAQVDMIAGNAQADIDVCIAELSAAFAKNDMDKASRLTTRFKYLRKLIEEARQKRARLKAGT